MKRILTALLLAAACCGASAQPSKEAVRKAIDECASYAANVLLDETGKSRCDYNLTRGEWYPYEEPWHTGQLVLGLLEAYKATGNKTWLEQAVRGGEWWLTLEIKDDPRFRGMVGATHGDVIGNDQIVFATVSDGTPGIFELSRVTGDRRYAALATSSAAWMLEHMYYPEEGVCYDLADLRTGEVLKLGSPFHGDKSEQTLFDVSRPNTEGSLFKDAYEFSGDERFRDAHILLCDALLRYQDEHGLWMDFMPNHKSEGSYHPRFNLWYAESLLECYDLTHDRKYLEAAARTARTYAAAQRKDGTMFYDNYINGRPSDKGSVCGSEVALAGILWMRLAEYGYGEFVAHYERSAEWLVKNRFSMDHPDPNLRGAVVNTRMRFRKGEMWMTQRDVGTSFGLRFLSTYYRKFAK